MIAILRPLFYGVAMATAVGATAASAAGIISQCNSLTDLSVQATSCSGWYAGNLLNNGHMGANVDAQIAALSTIGLNWDGNWGPIDLTKVGASGTAKNVFDFKGVLNGDVWIGIYKGKGGGNGFAGTAFYRLTASDLDAVTLNLKGASGAVVYAQQSPVPEPGTWAMLVVGFAALAAGLRRRSRTGLRWGFAG